MTGAPNPHDPANIRDPRQLNDNEWFEQAMRIATAPTDDDGTILAGMDRPATPEELLEFLERETARIQAERGQLPSP